MADAPKSKTAEELAKSTRSCANWCYWIAGLTAVNAGLTAFGSDTSFLVGSIVAQAVMFVSKQNGSVVMQVLALAFNAFVIAFFVVSGVFARKGHRWAFAVSFLAYTADTLVLFFDPSAIAIGFHAWALFSLWVGWSSARAWRKALAAEAVAIPPTLPIGAFVPATVIELPSAEVRSTTARQIDAPASTGGVQPLPPSIT